MNETMPDPRNDRVGAITPAGNGGSMGGQRGPLQPGMVGWTWHTGPSIGEIPKIGQADDSFVVYKGGDEKPLETPPAWRCMWPWMALALIRFPLWQVSGRPVDRSAEKAAAAKKPWPPDA